MTPRDHGFHAVAFEENLTLREIAAYFPEAKLSAHHLRIAVDLPGDTFVFPFGAIEAAIVLLILFEIIRTLTRGFD